MGFFYRLWGVLATSLLLLTPAPSLALDCESNGQVLLTAEIFDRAEEELAHEERRAATLVDELRKQSQSAAASLSPASETLLQELRAEFATREAAKPLFTDAELAEYHYTRVELLAQVNRIQRRRQTTQARLPTQVLATYRAEANEWLRTYFGEIPILEGSEDDFLRNVQGNFAAKKKPEEVETVFEPTFLKAFYVRWRVLRERSFIRSLLNDKETAAKMASAIAKLDPKHRDFERCNEGLQKTSLRVNTAEQFLRETPQGEWKLQNLANWHDQLNAKLVEIAVVHGLVITHNTFYPLEFTDDLGGCCHRGCPACSYVINANARRRIEGRKNKVNGVIAESSIYWRHRRALEAATGPLDHIRSDWAPR